jgi:cytochrome c-type biogenesis protein CcmF
MNPGNIILALTLACALASAIIFLTQPRGGHMLKVIAGHFSLCSTVGLMILSAYLLYALLSCDFSLLYVYENVSRSLHPVYRVAAFWAGKEGSFLLWVLALNISGLLLRRSKSAGIDFIIGIVTIVQCAIMVFLLLESPFRFIWDEAPETFAGGMVPDDGLGMNPLLVNPWMAVHPPVLLLGYAAAAVPFAFCLAALLRGKGESWAKDAYPWLLFSSISLGIGIALGGYWAYRVLGWGGYWGWDPVENSSLVPWLVSVALMHGMILERRANLFVRVNPLLIIAYFIMVFYGTYLTRSGALSDFSVHSFDSSGISNYLLAFWVLTSAISVCIYIYRMRELKGNQWSSRFDWKVLVLYGIIALFVFATLVSLGSSLPVLKGILSQKSSSGSLMYYKAVAFPLGSMILVLIALYASSIEKGQKPSILEKTGAALSVILGIAYNYSRTEWIPAYILSSFAILVLLIISLDVLKNKRLKASAVAHLGVAIFILGVVSSIYHSNSMMQVAEKGKPFILGPVSMIFEGTGRPSPQTLEFTVNIDGKSQKLSIPYFYSEKTRSIFREPVVKEGILSDIYISADAYKSGLESVTATYIKKGETKRIGEISIKFSGFITEHMTSEKPRIYADLVIDGAVFRPGFIMDQGKAKAIEVPFSGGRSISLAEIHAGDGAVVVYISPGPETKIPNDTVTVEVSVKPLVSAVWAGAFLVFAGSIMALWNATRKR